jgi:hypothetical protein
MKTVNITELPLYHKDNISPAILMNKVLYPDGIKIYFPAGEYCTGVAAIPISRIAGVPLVWERRRFSVIDNIWTKSVAAKPMFSFHTFLRAL